MASTDQRSLWTQVDINQLASTVASVQATVLGGSIALAPSGDTSGATDRAAIASRLTNYGFVVLGGTPSAPFYVDQPIAPSTNHPAVFGLGRGFTIVKAAAGANCNVIENANAGTTGDTNIVIRDLTIDGNKSTQNGDGTHHGLHLVCGAADGSPSSGLVSGVEARNCNGDGMKLDGAGLTIGPLQANLLYCHDNDAHGLLHTHALRRSQISEVLAENNGQYGVQLDASEAQIRGIKAKNNGWDGIHVSNIMGTSIDGLVAELNGRHGINISGWLYGVGASWRASGNGGASSNTYDEIHFSVNEDDPSGYGETNHVTVTGIFAGANPFIDTDPARYAVYFEDTVNLNVFLNGIEYGTTQSGQLRFPASGKGQIVILDHPTSGGNFRTSAGVMYGSTGLRAPTKAGTPVDGDVQTAGDGLVVVDTSASKLWARSGGSWIGTPLGTSGLAPGSQLGYGQRTTNINVTGTTAASPTDIGLSSGAVTYDGTDVWIEFFAPEYQKGTSSLTVVLYDGSTQLGNIGIAQANAGSQFMRVKVTPSAGSHTYKLQAFVDAGTGVVYAGDGSAGAFEPAYIRVTKA